MGLEEWESTSTGSESIVGIEPSTSRTTRVRGVDLITSMFKGHKSTEPHCLVKVDRYQSASAVWWDSSFNIMAKSRLSNFRLYGETL